MLTRQYWINHEFELAAGMLVYCIGLNEKILPNDLVRAENTTNKWLRMEYRYTACIGFTIAELNKKFETELHMEVLREYI
jgi:hypothetical protein